MWICMTDYVKFLRAILHYPTTSVWPEMALEDFVNDSLTVNTAVCVILYVKLVVDET